MSTTPVFLLNESTTTTTEIFGSSDEFIYSEIHNGPPSRCGTANADATVQVGLITVKHQQISKCDGQCGTANTDATHCVVINARLEHINKINHKAIFEIVELSTMFD